MGVLSLESLDGWWVLGKGGIFGCLRGGRGVLYDWVGYLITYHEIVVGDGIGD